MTERKSNYREFEALPKDLREIVTLTGIPVRAMFEYWKAYGEDAAKKQLTMNKHIVKILIHENRLVLLERSSD